MNDLTLKYNLLEPAERKQILDFMEFLLSKRMKSEEPVKTDLHFISYTLYFYRYYMPNSQFTINDDQ